MTAAADLWKLTRATDIEIAGVFNGVTDEITRIISSYPDRALTQAEYGSMMRRIDAVIEQTYGLTQGTALQSDIYGTIIRATDMSAEMPFRALLDDIAKGVEARGPGLWSRVHTRLMAGGTGPNDMLARAMVALDGPLVEKQRFLRSGLMDPQRKWVPKDKWTTKRGYRLSDRVWKSGRGFRGHITREIREAIRNGDGPITLARNLEPFLHPGSWPTAYTVNGARTTGKARSYPYAASDTRRLARTELARVNHAATREMMMGDIPGKIGIRWRNANTHTHIDICTEYATDDRYGLGAGVFPAEEFPDIPHPFCMCNAVPVLKSREDVIDEIIERYAA